MLVTPPIAPSAQVKIISIAYEAYISPFPLVPVNAPSILAAALIEGPKDSNTSLLFINLEESTFPTGASSACQIRVTSMASVTIQRPCEEVILTSLTSLPSHPLNVTVASVLGNSIGPK